MWWESLKAATRQVISQAGAKGDDIAAIGISYQMHGLVCVDRNGKVLRPSIIWCDGRAVSYGNEAFHAIGKEKCLAHLLNSPGNFTASKLAWVKDNEPRLFERIDKIMLPGDYIAMKLSGQTNTTIEGLSEGIFWDFRERQVSNDIMSHFGFPTSIIPDIVPTFGHQGEVREDVAEELGLKAGTPIAYRGGDQPNNALSLGVMKPGEIAATGGTSGVVYGVLGEVNYDRKSRVNTFAHVNYTPEKTRLGVLLCINGTGILNAWMRRNVAPEGISYADINDLAAQAPVGSEGLSVIPFGNGAERILENRDTGCSIHGINFNIHNKAHLLRAAQEGIVYSFRYGMDIMRDMGMDIHRIHAGHANMFLSPLFREALATVSGAVIDLYDTDGAAGAAKGAGIGCGIYKDDKEAFSTLRHIMSVEPQPTLHNAYQASYQLWKERLTPKQS